jgi:hypothetical protein
MEANTSEAPLSASTIHRIFGNPPTSTHITAYLDSLSISSASSTPLIKSYSEATYHAYHSLGLDLIYAPSDSKPDPAHPEQLELDRIDIYNPVPGVNLPGAGSSRRRPPPTYSSPDFPVVIQLAQTPILPPAPAPVPPPGYPNASALPANAISVQAMPPAAQELVHPTGTPVPFVIDKDTTGRDFVAALGEPTRKGGAKGWVGPWLEWSELRVLAPTLQHKRCRSEQTDASEAREEVGIGLMVELRPAQRELTEEEKKKGMGGVWDMAAGWEWGCIKFFRVGSTT